MDNLRRQALEILKQNQTSTQDLSKFEMQKLIEELQVHQIELQVQNEELQEKRLEIETARKKYFNIFDMAPIGYLVINVKGIILEANLKVTEIFQRRKDYLMNRPLVSILNAQSMSSFYENFETVRATGANTPFELQIHRGIEQVYIEITISTYIDDTYLVILSEITERKKAGNKLLESEKKYRNLFEKANDAIFVADAQTGIVVDANQKAENLIGKSKREIIGMHQSQLHPKEIEETVSASFKSDLKEKENLIYKEFYVVHQNGETIPVEISPSIVDVEDKTYVYGIFRDITERKKTEENLQIKNKAIEESISAIAFASIEGKLTYINNSFLKLWGYESDSEVIGRSPLEFWNTPSEAHNVMEILFNEGTFKGEMIGKRKDNTLFPVQLLGSLIRNNDGKPVLIYGSFIDISEQKENEKTINNYVAELQTLNATKDKFFGIIAHDLKSPFNNILGFAELLHLNLEKYDTDKVGKFVKMIYDTSKNTYKLLQNLLEWSLMQRDILSFKPEVLCLDEFLTEKLTTFNQQAEYK